MILFPPQSPHEPSAVNLIPVQWDTDSAAIGLLGCPEAAPCRRQGDPGGTLQL